MLQLYNTNVVGVALVTEAVGVLREGNKGGKVINVSSVMGSIARTQQQGRPNGSTYRCSKAAQV